MKRELRTVTTAARRKRASDQAYRDAIVQARTARHTYEAIGQAAGTTKQAIQQLLARNTREDAPLPNFARCGNCGADAKQHCRWDPADGWSCSRCYLTDAAE